MLPLMVVKSPRCDEMVTLPAGLTPDTRVRCPFTKEEFLIQEILDALPPELEVLERPAGAAAAAGTAAAVGATVVADDAGPIVAEVDEDAGKLDMFKSDEVAVEKESDESADATDADKDAPADPVFDFLGAGGAAAASSSSEPQASGAALFEPEAATENTAAAPFNFAGDDADDSPGGDAATGARRKARPRPQKKQKNALMEIVKVVLGGVAGLLIAQMILWWLPGSWARDPANLAPKLPGFLSWAAPERMRNPDGVLPPAGPADDTSSNPNAKNGEQQIVAENDPDVLDTPLALPGSGDQAADTTDDVLDPNADMDDDNGGVSVVDGTDFDPIGDVAIDNPLDITDPVEEVIGVRSAPVFSGEELGDSLKDASAAKEIVDSAGGLDLSNGRPQAAAFYKAFCKLAERATFVDPGGQQVEPRLEAVEGMLVDLGTKKKNVDAIGGLAATWMNLGDNRPSDGVMLAGTVKSIAPQGKLYDTEVQLFAKDQPMVTVMSKNDPSRKIAEGDRVIILGTVVEEPSLKLAGYEGNLPQVVWGGYPVALPKANRPSGRKAGGGGGN